MESLKELIDKRAKLIADNRKILDTADKEKRALTGPEREQYDKADAEVETLSTKIDEVTGDEKRRERHARYDAMLTASAGRQTAVLQPSLADLRTAPNDGGSLSFDFGRAGKLNLAELEIADPQCAAQLRRRASPEYSRAFTSFLRGDAKGERLGLEIGTDPKGGYLVPMGFLGTLTKFLDDLVFMRRLGTVLPPTLAKSVGMLSYDTDYADADWTAEVTASDISEDDAARFGQREMMPHMLTKLVKCGKKLLRSSTFGIQSFVAGRAAYKFAITENKAFLSGTGSQRPLGVFVANNDGIPTTRDTTCASQTVFTADELLDCQESLKTAYQQKAQWLVSRGFRQRARKLKDGNGQYLLHENNAGGLTTLLGSTLNVDENAPSTFTTGQYIAVYADFSYYWIQDSIDWSAETLDQLFTLRNQIGWLFRKETDGMPVLAEAFGRLKLA